MKTRSLISSAAVAFATLTACGGTDASALDGGPTYSLQSGRYAVSNVQTVERDWCGILPADNLPCTSSITFTAKRVP